MVQLEDHECSMAHLEAVMRRAGTYLLPDEFIEAVAIAFQDSRDASNLSSDTGFKGEGSYQHFREALGCAGENGGSIESVLVLGCGAGYGGKPAGFAARTVAEEFESTSPGGAGRRRIVTRELTPGILRESARQAGSKTGGEKHDLVVAHSLLHYVPDLKQFFKYVESTLAPNGALILSHEPNAAFWANPEIREALAALRKDRQQAPGWMNYLKLQTRSVYDRVKPNPTSVWAKVNRRLRERYGFRQPLRENEIRRLVDVHRPEVIPGGFRIGTNGFDLAQLQKTYLPGFQLVRAWSSAHLGYLSSGPLTPEWHLAEKRLAEKYPLDGSVFTGYWTRQS